MASKTKNVQTLVGQLFLDGFNGYSVPAEFRKAISDFHLGGTDTKGFFIGGSYGLDKNTWLNLRWMSADSISGPPLGIDVLQLDLYAKF